MRRIGCSILLLAAACARPPASSAAVGVTHTRSADVTTWLPGLTPNLSISPQLMRWCRPRFGEIGVGAPYSFQAAGLEPEDASLLLQLAQCVERGIFEGHVLILVRRADADGSLPVSAERIERVRRYLIGHGLPPEQIETRDIPPHAGRARDRRIGVYVTAG